MTKKLTKHVLPGQKVDNVLADPNTTTVSTYQLYTNF